MRPSSTPSSHPTATAAVALVGTADEILWRRRATPETRFDYASLTKPFTFTLALVLDQDGTLPLATRIGEVFPEANREAGRPAALRPPAPSLRAGILGAALSSLPVPGGRPAAPARREQDAAEPARRVQRSGRPSLWACGGEGHRPALCPSAPVAGPRSPRPPAVEPAPGDRPDIARSFMDTDKEVKLAARQGLPIPLQGPPPRGLPQDGNARFLWSSSRRPGPRRAVRQCPRPLAPGAEWLAPRTLLKPEATAAALTGEPVLPGLVAEEPERAAPDRRSLPAPSVTRASRATASGSTLRTSGCSSCSRTGPIPSAT